jgi:hypothetical protein
MPIGSNPIGSHPIAADAQPGGALSATMASTGALSASLTGAGALADTMAGVGALSASHVELISDTMNGVGALSPALAGAGALTDSMAAVGALSGTLLGAGALSDTMAGVGSLSATPAGVGALADTMAATGALSATASGSGTLQMAATMSAVGALSATPSGGRPPVVVGGQFSFGGSLQPQPLTSKERKPRRFKSAAETEREREERLRELEKAAAAEIAARQAEQPTGLPPKRAPATKRKDAPAVILGTARSEFRDGRFFWQMGFGESLHVGVAAQVLADDGAQRERADAATSEVERLRAEVRHWKRRVAAVHVAQLHAKARADSDATTAAIMAIRIPPKTSQISSRSFGRK